MPAINPSSSSTSEAGYALADLPPEHGQRAPEGKASGKAGSQESPLSGLNRRSSAEGVAPRAGRLPLREAVQHIVQARSSVKGEDESNEQLFRIAQAQRNVNILVDAVPRLVQERRAQRTAYMDGLAALVSTGDYRQPEAHAGVVTRNAQGQFVCTDKAVQAVLRFVQETDPEAARGVDVSQGCRLSLPLESQILLKTQLFEEGCKARKLDLTDDADAASGINLTTYSLRQAVTKGTSGFTPDAKLAATPSAPAVAEDGTPRSASAAMPDTHPFAFLQDIRYTVESDSAPLKALVERALNKTDPTTLELRGRLGAQAIHAVISQKRFSKELGIAVAASLIGSGAIAYAMDVWVWKSAIAAMAERYGEHSPQVKCAMVILYSLTPLLAETLDSLVVKRLLGVFKREPLLPQSIEEFTNDLKGASLAGGIAAVGAVANSGVGLLKGWAWMPLNLLTNQIAASTSGAMVPLEVKESHDQMVEGVIRQMDDGFFPKPGHAGDTDPANLESGKALELHVKRDTKGALGVAPGDGLSINSMGIGSLLSAMVFIPIDAATRAGLLGESVKKVVTIVINTPTEILSLATGIFAANHIKLGNLMTTDAGKNQRMVELIASKAVERLQNPGKTAVAITEKELQAIEHPGMALTYPAGKAIVGSINGVVDLVANAWSAMQPGSSDRKNAAAPPSAPREMPGAFPAET